MASPASKPNLALPIGWPLLPLPDANGQLNYPSLDQSVRQLIQVILRTRPGEQLMHPVFGAGVQDYLQQPNTLTTRRRIHDAVQETLQEWEPRILLDRVDVSEVPDYPARLRIEIAYRLKRTNSSQKLGFSMDLEG